MLEIGPDGIAEAAERFRLTAAEARLLAPDHPFLRAGRWRAFAAEQPGAAAEGRGAAVARLVASVDPRQASGGRPVGCIGFVRLGDDARAAPTDAPGASTATTSASDAASAPRRALDAAVEWLRAHGVAQVRCPVQLSTWYGHRAMTGGFPGGPATTPAFAFEPASEPALPGLLEAAGFRPVHRAVSCLEDSTSVVAGAAPAIRRARAAGVRDRPIRLANLDAELVRIQRLAEATFRGSWGISPISVEEFASIYRPLEPQVDPELVRLLEDADGTAIGFVLGFLPASLGAGTCAPGEAFVLKSIGVTAEARRRVPGLGAALIGRIHEVAIDRGCRAGIHALMAEGSAGHRLSLRWGASFRSYATYELDLP